MTKDSQAVKVRILDKEYKVACPIGKHKSLIASASYVDKQMREIRGSGRVISLDRLAVMVALNVTHEMLLTQSQMKRIDDDVIERLENLYLKIHKTLDAVKKSS